MVISLASTSIPLSLEAHPYLRLGKAMHPHPSNVFYSLPPVNLYSVLLRKVRGLQASKVQPRLHYIYPTTNPCHVQPKPQWPPTRASPSSLSSSCSPPATSAQLSTDYYYKSCPNLFLHKNRGSVGHRSSGEGIGASARRLFFHDCFVQGCDGSLLLDDTANFTGEKNATPNKNSVRGFDVVDKIKAAVVESLFWRGLLRDVLAITARDPVVILRANVESWAGEAGPRTASFSGANNNIPPPTSSLSNLISKLLRRASLDQRDGRPCSGAHYRTGAVHQLQEQDLQRGATSTRGLGVAEEGRMPEEPGDNNLAPLDSRRRRRSTTTITGTRSA
ncbi:hypothetical protein HPP92_011977 [Vanilla planifolia]|uniref:Peroxidase n=1 Tax=Vanilla planifolia TaxID=51239 RepID=A0A835UYZ1_VANPL|nr:hypothetical protein HPP92_011977 [Vanilla planifolia]